MQGFLCFILGVIGIFGGLVASAWEFPRVALSPQSPQRPLSLDDEDIDIITGSAFRGLKTFANLRYANCFSDEDSEGNPYDIAILGAPFDTVSS